MAVTSDEKVEKRLFVIWVQDQRHDHWMKFIKEIEGELEKLREEIKDGDNPRGWGSMNKEL